MVTLLTMPSSKTIYTPLPLRTNRRHSAYKTSTWNSLVFPTCCFGPTSMLKTIFIIATGVTMIVTAMIMYSLGPKSGDYVCNFQATKAITIDVLSVNSETRLDYAKAQRQTWGQSSNIRQFRTFTEIGTNDTCQYDADLIRQRCSDPDHHVRLHPPYIGADSYNLDGSDGWHCAQKRPMLGLAIMLHEYRIGRTPYPDWLLVVDDDTYYRMDVLSASLSAVTSEIKVPIGLTNHVMKFNDEQPERIMLPYGGGGYVMNKQLLMALTTPIHCSKVGISNDRPSLEAPLDIEYACAQLSLNVAGELDVHTKGMDLAQLMNATVRGLPGRPLCWHSDWFLGWFIAEYVKTDRSSVFDDHYPCIDRKKHTAQWKVIGDGTEPCLDQYLACHHQTPEDMRQRYNRTHYSDGHGMEIIV